jgi:cytochrome c-type biogenesis protein CcmH
MIHSRTSQGVILCVVSLWIMSCPAWAIDPAPLLPDPAQQQRYLKLIHELRCLQCQGETIADTQALFAVDVRRQVREMVAKGSSDQDVRKYMVDRYGEIILLRPEWSAATGWLWLAPVVFLIGGALVAWRILRKRRVLLDSDNSTVDDESSRA